MSTEPTPLSEPAVYFADASDISKFTNSRPKQVAPKVQLRNPGADRTGRSGLLPPAGRTVLDEVANV